MFNEFICIFRRYCELSQEDVAAAARIPLIKYREYENGITDPSEDELRRLATVYGLNEDIFSLGVEPIKKTYAMFEPKSADATIFESEEDMQKVRLLINTLSRDEARLILLYRTATEEYKARLLALAQEANETVKQ